MNEFEKAWLACAIDAEGCILAATYTNKKHPDRYILQLRLTVTNTKRPFLDEARRITRCGKIYFNQVARSYVLQISKHEEMARILLTVRPYLILKLKQADVFFEILNALTSTKYGSKTKSSDIQHLCKYMHVLNEPQVWT